MEVLLFLFFAGIVSILILVNYKIAKMFQKIASAKTNERTAKHAFELCFWLGLVGYLYVIALPNANFEKKSLKSQKEMLELLEKTRVNESDAFPEI